MSADLRFQWPVTPTPGPADLRFGSPDVVAVDSEGALLITIAPPAPPASFSATGSVVLDLIDADGVRAGMRQQQAIPLLHGLGIQQQQMQQMQHGMPIEHQQAIPLPIGLSISQQQMQRLIRAVNQRHQHGIAAGNGMAIGHAEMLRYRYGLRLDHQHGIPIDAGFRFGHAEQIRVRPPLVMRHQHGIAAWAGIGVGHHHGLPVAVPLRMDHQQMIKLPIGWWQGTYPWPPVPPPPWSNPVDLRFCKHVNDTHILLFGHCGGIAPPAGVVVPILEYYLVIYDFSLVVAGTGQPVPVENFSCQIDVDSWTWGWSANLHASLASLVRSPEIGEYVELIATINGTAIRVMVERMSRDRRFANATLRISGRGRAAWLADPHSLIQTRSNALEMTAVQLLEDALTFSGIPIGWSVDWQIEDWLVPAGAWSHTGTYIDAAMRIAQAGGGYVQAHNTAQTLRVLPRYPVTPWAWGAATPDIELPDAPVEVESIEWSDRPQYNAVWIAGGESGRLDRVLRAGSAGDLAMQTIVDPLATDPAMTRQRGTAALADTGRQAHITVRLPVLPETGIIQPGKLIRYTENGVSRVGLSRAVSVESKFPETWQTVRIETHE